VGIFADKIGGND
jgi:hypothetical protein